MRISNYKEQQGSDTIVRFAQDYIKRTPKEFLFPTRDKSVRNGDSCIIYKSIEEYWQRVLSLKKSAFLKGWVPATTSTTQTLYTQLFNHYFDHPIEIEKKLSRSKRQLQWFPPQWFQQCQPLSPSGRMGQVYTSQCKIPGSPKLRKCIIREMNLCMLLQGNIERIIPDYVDGITATLHYHERRLAFVSIIPDTTITLEQLIPQVDQWSLQKLYRVALTLCSTVRDFHAQNRIHPNLQPKNILVDSDNAGTRQEDDSKNSNSSQRRRSSSLFRAPSYNETFRLIDDWPSLPLCSHYGRYPYIAPELYSDTNNMHLSQKSNIYSLGVILWQLACGVIFPSSVPLSSLCYRLEANQYCIPSDYKDMIARCLHRNPARRPSADQLCEGLLRLLMTELAACPTPRCIQDQRAHCIRERQLCIAKYLVKNGADKQDIRNLLSQASITKRMALHVVVSLEKHNLYWYSKPTTGDDYSATTRKRRNSSSSSSCEREELDNHSLTQAAEYQLFHSRSTSPTSLTAGDSTSTEIVLKTHHDCCSKTTTKCTPTTTTTKATVLAAHSIASLTERKVASATRLDIRQSYNGRHLFSSSGANTPTRITECSIYGADLPDLVQMGFA